MTTDRMDLAAMLAPIIRTLIELERPILDANGLSMWSYSVLLALDETPVRTQSALAAQIGADKTRIIADLDVLQAEELITREPDPEDRRIRLVAITPRGRRVRDRTQTQIQRKEDTLLAELPATERKAFLKALRTLHGVIRTELS